MPGRKETSESNEMDKAEEGDLSGETCPNSSFFFLITPSPL